MKIVDTREYISTLRSLTEEGYEVSVTISGNSMSPFLMHQRDPIYFKKPDRKLVRGDMVFFQRADGNYVMHRIWKVKEDGYYIVGDAQNIIEGPVRQEQIFGLITKVQRKGKWAEPGDFWWDFFERVWIGMVPIRRPIMRMYSLLRCPVIRWKEFLGARRG